MRIWHRPTQKPRPDGHRGAASLFSATSALDLVQRVRHEAEIPRALDGLGELPLVRCAEVRAPPRHDLLLRRHEAEERVGVLIVNDLAAQSAKKSLFLFGCGHWGGART